MPSKKVAFTLAETLITLAIIGVVAAMTLPTLITKHQKDVILTQLKKSYSTFSNAIRLSEINNGPMKDWPTDEQIDVISYWETYLNPYFNNAKLCMTSKDCGYLKEISGKANGWTDLDWAIKTSYTRLLFQLYDGTVVFFPRNTEDSNGSINYITMFYIDVNGPKLPNKYCKDVFPFVRKTNNVGIEPIDCAKAIMENNWKFPDNYKY